MARTHRLPTTGALIVCLLSTLWSGTLVASEEQPSSESAASSATPSAGPPVIGATDLWSHSLPAIERPRFTCNDAILSATAPIGGAGAQSWQTPLASGPTEPNAFAQRGRYWGGRGRRNGGAQTAIIIGTVASITGAALLVYANRPECGTNQT